MKGLTQPVDFKDTDGEAVTIWRGGRSPKRLVYVHAPGVISLSSVRAREFAAKILALADSLDTENEG